MGHITVFGLYGGLSLRQVQEAPRHQQHVHAFPHSELGGPVGYRFEDKVGDDVHEGYQGGGNGDCSGHQGGFGEVGC